MRTATVREAQHHLAKLLEEVAAGREVILTRRGQQVAKLAPLDPADADEAKVDWQAWLDEQRTHLESMPTADRNAVLEERESYRW